MTKNTGDLILRDRMEFDLDAGGDRTTVYGRIDLSSYISVTGKKGLAIKEIFFHVREQNSTLLDNTGIWDWMVADELSSDAGGHVGALKLYATTRAYENAADVGIASPDVICLREYISSTSPNGAVAGTGTSYAYSDRYYGPGDLHPEGYTVVTDLLIGVAASNCTKYQEETIEIDIMMIAEPKKVTKDDLERMLAQATDL